MSFSASIGSFSASASLSFPAGTSSTTGTTIKSITAGDFDVYTSLADWSLVKNSRGEHTSLSTTTLGAAAQYEFIGTGIKVKGTIPSLFEGLDSPVGLYYIDGVLDTTYHYIRHSTPNSNYTFFESPALSAGQHTLLIESDVDGAYFTLDYIDVTVPNELVGMTPTGWGGYPTNTAWFVPSRPTSTYDYPWRTATATPTSSYEYPYGYPYQESSGHYAGRIVLNIVILILIILGVFLVFAGIGGLLYYFLYWPNRKKRRDKQWAKYAAAASAAEAGLAAGGSVNAAAATAAPTIIDPGGVLYAPIPIQSTANLTFPSPGSPPPQPNHQAYLQPQPQPQQQPQPQLQLQQGSYADAPLPSSPTSHPQELFSNRSAPLSPVVVPVPSQSYQGP